MPSVALFPDYCFILIERGWWEARWSPGAIRLIASGFEPEHVPGRVIDDLRAREVGGLVEPPEAPRFRPGDKVRSHQGTAQRLPGDLRRDETTPEGRDSVDDARRATESRAAED